MRMTRITWCFAAAALVLGCHDQVTEPAAQADAIDQPAFGAEHEGVESVGYFNDVMFYPCLNDGEGEVVWERGQRPNWSRRVYQPSGNQNRSTTSLDWIGLPEDDPYYNGPDYTILGLESGDLWIMDAANSQAKSRKLVKKDGFVYHQQWNIWYENQDGERVHILDKYNLHCDFDWNCTQERVGGICSPERIDSGPPVPLP